MSSTTCRRSTIREYQRSHTFFLSITISRPGKKQALAAPLAAASILSSPFFLLLLSDAETRVKTAASHIARL